VVLRLQRNGVEIDGKNQESGQRQLKIFFKEISLRSSGASILSAHQIFKA
jgi:hypothetical protein